MHVQTVSILVYSFCTITRSETSSRAACQTLSYAYLLITKYPNPKLTCLRCEHVYMLARHLSLTLTVESGIYEAMYLYTSRRNYYSTHSDTAHVSVPMQLVRQGYSHLGTIPGPVQKRAARWIAAKME